ncbi:MAG TPA: hypothetical protein VNH45_16100 [Gaiellaceae bacterium]|jgi:hypothetical protein|nr:hypothetical protein [Gaiellaceae bacterium]
MIRTRLRPSAAFLSVASAALLAGCGSSGGPHLTHNDAAPLITLADKISREAPCAQARDIRVLRTRTIALVNTHRVPAALQETLTSGVNALVAPVCLPSVAPTPTITIIPSHGKGHKHGHGKGDGGD